MKRQAKCIRKICRVVCIILRNPVTFLLLYSQKPRTWGEALKRRLGRIWKDLSNGLVQKFHDKVKRVRKRSRHSFNVREVMPASEMRETKEQRKEGEVDRGYEKAVTQVHPFHITE